MFTEFMKYVVVCIRDVDRRKRKKLSICSDNCLNSFGLVSSRLISSNPIRFKLNTYKYPPVIDNLLF